jgi:regulator of sirC expression with transglutaminase-like and TPR domain
MESENPAALLRSAQLHIRREKWDAARSDLDVLLRNGDENPQACYARALCREHLGDPAGAADDLERILPAFGDPADRQALQERIEALRAGSPS